MILWKIDQAKNKNILFKKVPKIICLAKTKGNLGKKLNLNYFQSEMSKLREVLSIQAENDLEDALYFYDLISTKLETTF